MANLHEADLYSNAVKKLHKSVAVAARKPNRNAGVQRLLIIVIRLVAPPPFPPQYEDVITELVYHCKHYYLS